jgi:hypothetical protein
MDLHGKALYLSYDGLTDPLGQAQILPYLLGLEQQGMGFVIISFEKKEAFSAHKHTCTNNLKEEISNGYHFPTPRNRL